MDQFLFELTTAVECFAPMAMAFCLVLAIAAVAQRHSPKAKHLAVTFHFTLDDCRRLDRLTAVAGVDGQTLVSNLLRWEDHQLAKETTN